MKTKIISIAIASILSTGSIEVMANPLDDEGATNNSYAEIGIGAVGGAILGGPVGILVGGAIGGIIGGQEEADEVQAIEDLAEYESMLNEEQASVTENNEPENILLASVDSSIPLVAVEQEVATNALRDIISNDLSLDVYFKDGSVDGE